MILPFLPKPGSVSGTVERVGEALHGRKDGEEGDYEVGHRISAPVG